MSVFENPKFLETRSTALASLLRSEILSGELPPGHRLHLEMTRKRFDVSLSPLREALSRLTAEGLVTSEDQKGYRVAPVSIANFREVMRLRVVLEVLALREAASLDRESWRQAINDAWMNLDIVSHAKRDSRWEGAHRRFHLALIEGCGLPMLVEFIAGLHDLSDRYRRLFLQENAADRNVAAEHARIVDAAKHFEIDLAAALLSQHIERTGTKILAHLTERETMSNA